MNSYPIAPIAHGTELSLACMGSSNRAEQREVRLGNDRAQSLTGIQFPTIVRRRESRQREDAVNILGNPDFGLGLHLKVVRVDGWWQGHERGEHVGDNDQHLAFLNVDLGEEDSVVTLPSE